MHYPDAFSSAKLNEGDASVCGAVVSAAGEGRTQHIQAMQECNLALETGTPANKSMLPMLSAEGRGSGSAVRLDQKQFLPKFSFYKGNSGNGVCREVSSERVILL